MRSLFAVFFLSACAGVFAAPVTANLKSLGSISMPAPTQVSPAPKDENIAEALDHHFEFELHAYLAGTPPPAHLLPSLPGEAPNAGVAVANKGFTGFEGLNHADQRFAGSGNYANTQYSLEPPDQGLCVGNGFVLEAVNTAFAVFNRRGQRLTGPIAANQFFGLMPEINRITGVSGDFTSDPKCAYDWTLDRWYLTMLQMDAVGVRSHTLIAVSRSGDPTGDWDRYWIDTTNDGQGGTPAHPGCPCFGDQPLLGFDRNAVFITTNEFGSYFNGAQVYAIGKSLFAGGAGSAVHFDNLGLEEGPAYSLQPATTPPGGEFATSKGGTGFFASALDFTGPYDDRLAVWAMTGTASLNTAQPEVALAYSIVQSLPYGMPPDATQKAGPTPLRDQLNQIWASYGFDSNVEQIETLAANDDRMNQTVFNDGKLWGALNTALHPVGDSSLRAGVLWFRIEAAVEDKGVVAKMDRQGYVAQAGMDVFFPSVAVNSSGSGAIGFSLAGPGRYPSTGYTVLDDDGTGAIHVAGAGQLPQDGFTGYQLYGGTGSSRWGDYSAAVADTDGSIWMAAQFTSSRPRSLLANWGTYLTRLR
jgi:hypothetical protein